MTTFGGHSVPFTIGEGGFSSVWSFIGATLTQLNSTDGAVTFSPIAGNVGDLLVAASFGADFVTGNYSSNVLNIGFGKMGNRLATNDANDDLTTAANPGEGSQTYILRFRLSAGNRSFVRQVFDSEIGTNPEHGILPALPADAGITDSLIICLSGYGANSGFDIGDTTQILAGNITDNFIFVNGGVNSALPGPLNVSYRSSCIAYKFEAAANAIILTDWPSSNSINFNSTANGYLQRFEIV